MFNFLKVVGAVYFYHRHSKKFLGYEKKPGVGFNYPIITPVEDIKNAVDFKIREGSVMPTAHYDPQTLKDITEIPNTPFIRVLLPNGKDSFDTVSGTDRDGNVMIAYPNHTRTPQIYTLQMLADFSFVFAWGKRCMVYNENTKNFYSGTCKDLYKSSFDLYLELKYPKETIKEDIYKADALPILDIKNKIRSYVLEIRNKVSLKGIE